MMTMMTASCSRPGAAVAAAILAVVLLAHEAVVVDAAAKLPSNFKRCSVSDAKINDCLKVAVEDAFHKMKDGVNNLGMLPVDPLKVDEIKIDQGQGTSVSMNMDLKNISMYGLADTKITNYSANFEDGVLMTESLTPRLKMDFMHVTSGRILLLPIRGEGPGSIVMNDLVVHHYLKFVPKTKKDGKKYWSIQEYKIKLKPRTLSLDLKGLFGGDGRLSEQMNTFMNQNAMLIFEEIGGAFEDAYGAVFKEITSRLFNKVPFDEVFMTDKKP